MQDFLIMNTLGYPILSLLIFLPLAGVIPLLILKNDEAAKYWTLVITLVIALVSLPLYFKFDKTTALYQFGEHHPWIRHSSHVESFAASRGWREQPAASDRGRSSPASPRGWMTADSHCR